MGKKKQPLEKGNHLLAVKRFILQSQKQITINLKFYQL